jgi:RNA polymerase sigma-70 factor (ECF subfamily)
VRANRRAEELAPPGGQTIGRTLAAEAALVEQLRSGAAEAGRRFVRDYYPHVYHYLLFLTGRRDTAEDLTQETFLRAWRGLPTFEGRAPLRLWLHRIAHREFLRSLRNERPETSLEQVAEPPAPDGAAWTEAIELRAALRRLPVAEREVVTLHYLQGYACQEIAQIVGVPAGTVKYRLSEARAHLQQALGEGDLIYLNEPSLPMWQWPWLPLEQMRALEARLTRGEGISEEIMVESDKLSRRRFLTAAAGAGAAALAGGSESGVIDPRLTRKMTLALKATALTDLCDHLTAESGIKIVAGASVADEKVTLFCKGMPLREVMRQLSRPFGYAWLRSGKAEEYRYELVQDLRSQLLEEELRNRDRDTALLALDHEMERYRPYLELSPDEALARARTAPPGDRKLLEKLATSGWGPIHLYFRLSPRQLTALRAGQELRFSSSPAPGDEPLPPDVARGVLQARRDLRIIREDPGEERRGDGFRINRDPSNPIGLPLTAIPEARALVTVALRQSELGRFTLDGTSGVRVAGHSSENGDGPYGVGLNPAVLRPDNGAPHLKLAAAPALRLQVSVQPQPSCGAAWAVPAGDERVPEPKVTTADVLEALHNATGLPIVADYYTRLYTPSEVTMRNRPVFEALNQVADAMRLRWRWDDGWLQFRSASYYDDRLKEVPNRLLARWASARRQHGMLRLDDLIEIVELSDAQLDGADMAEGARECHGLAEWDLVRNGNLRPHLRNLAGLTSAQRQEAMSPAGLAFTRMSLAQQQGFLSLSVTTYTGPAPSLEELQGAVLRIDYTQPGWFTWRVPGPWWLRWVAPLEPGPEGRRALMPPVRERTRAAALLAARELASHLSEAARQITRRDGAVFDAANVLQEAEMIPTQLDLAIIYLLGTANRHSIVVERPDHDSSSITW